MNKTFKENLDMNHKFYILFLNIEMKLHKINYFEMLIVSHKLLSLIWTIFTAS